MSTDDTFGRGESKSESEPERRNDPQRDDTEQSEGYIDQDLSARYGSEGGQGGGQQADDVAGVSSDLNSGLLRRWGKLGIIVVGVLMLFIPEPITSILGLVFIVAGILLWVADLIR